MSVGSGVASYGGSAAIMQQVSAALMEHGVNLGANTTALLAIVLGFVVHILAVKYGGKLNAIGVSTNVSEKDPDPTGNIAAGFKS